MIRVLENLKKIRALMDRDLDHCTWTEAAQAVVDGRAAMYFMGDWAKTVFKSNKLPYGPDGYQAIPVPGTRAVFLKGSGKNHPAQEALAAVIMEREVQEGFNRLKGSIPVATDASRNNFDEVSRMSLELVATGEFVLSFNYRQTSSEKLHDAVVQSIFEFYNSEMSAADAAKRLAQVAAENR